jgi:RNA polymerase sigma-70 factor (ECF subfamily)
VGLGTGGKCGSAVVKIARRPAAALRVVFSPRRGGEDPLTGELERWTLVPMSAASIAVRPKTHGASAVRSHARSDACDPLTTFRLRSAAAESSQAARASRLAVARAKQGDREALRHLYVRYADNVYSYVMSIVRNHHEAEDVTQQVFAKLADSLRHYEDRGAPFLSWLVRLARNAAIDQLRSRRAVPVAEPIERLAPTEEGSARERRETLRSALERLPEDQREIIVLRHLGGLAPAEIAQRLGRSESAVNGLHHRGRRALRAELTRLGVAPMTMAA